MRHLHKILLLCGTLILSSCDFFVELLQDAEGTRLDTRNSLFFPTRQGMHTRSNNYYDPDLCYPGLLERSTYEPHAYLDWFEPTESTFRSINQIGVMVGYENIASPGQSCVPQTSNVFQGRFLFEFEGLPRDAIVRNAELIYERRNHFSEGHGGQEARHCRRGFFTTAGFIEAGVTSEPFVGPLVSGAFADVFDPDSWDRLISYRDRFFFPSGEAPRDYQEERVDVTRQVQLALRTASQDFNLVLSPDPHWIDRSIDVGRDGQDVIHCINYYRGMRIVIHYEFIPER